MWTLSAPFAAFCGATDNVLMEQTEDEVRETDRRSDTDVTAEGEMRPPLSRTSRLRMRNNIFVKQKVCVPF